MEPMVGLRRSRALFFSFLLSTATLSMTALTACNGSGDSSSAGASAGSVLGSDAPNSDGSGDSSNPTSPPASDSDTMTIGVKYVALRSSESDTTIPTQAAVQAALDGMSSLWAQCKIRFVLDSYSAPLASASGLSYTVSALSSLYDYRHAFDDGNAALIVRTGAWDHSGTLGGSNGYSTIPPATVEGTVVESKSQTSKMLLSHEIGHLIGGLGHTTGTNLMNHMVASTNTVLTQSQCDTTRSVMNKYHASWLR